VAIELYSGIRQKSRVQLHYEWAVQRHTVIASVPSLSLESSRGDRHRLSWVPGWGTAPLRAHRLGVLGDRAFPQSGPSMTGRPIDTAAGQQGRIGLICQLDGLSGDAVGRIRMRCSGLDARDRRCEQRRKTRFPGECGAYPFLPEAG
jgi:hypothetical protein